MKSNIDIIKDLMCGISVLKKHLYKYKKQKEILCNNLLKYMSEEEIENSLKEINMEQYHENVVNKTK